MTKNCNRHGEADARTKEKGHAEAQPTSKSTDDNYSADIQRKPHTDIDPVMGWHALAKAARLAQDRKRGKRGAR
jgi:hypothetical protein